MSQSYSKKYTMPHLNGFAAAAVLVAITLFVVWRMFSALENGAGGLGFLLLPLGYCFTHFRVVQPNTALVGTLFGKYAGVLPKSGFFLAAAVLQHGERVAENGQLRYRHAESERCFGHAD